MVCLHAAVLHKQTFFLQVGIQSHSHVKIFCFSVNHTILLCSSALAYTAAISFVPPLTQGVSTPFGETIIPGSLIPLAHSSPCFCAFLKFVKFISPWKTELVKGSLKPAEAADSLLRGLEEVVVTQGFYWIQMQLTAPLSDPTGWLKERMVKSQCWLFFTNAKTGGFEPWFGFWFHLSCILRDKWLKLAILVIVKQGFFWVY